MQRQRREWPPREVLRLDNPPRPLPTRPLIHEAPPDTVALSPPRQHGRCTSPWTTWTATAVSPISFGPSGQLSPSRAAATSERGQTPPMSTGPAAGGAGGWRLSWRGLRESGHAAKLVGAVPLSYGGSPHPAMDRTAGTSIRKPRVVNLEVEPATAAVRPPEGPSAGRLTGARPPARPGGAVPAKGG